MHSLIFHSSKFTFLLLATISFPVLLETEMILQLWLETVPNYTAVFVRLMLCTTIIDAMAGAFMVSAQATGAVRVYQSVVGGILLTIVPVSYIVLKWVLNLGAYLSFIYVCAFWLLQSVCLFFVV